MLFKFLGVSVRLLLLMAAVVTIAALRLGRAHSEQPLHRAASPSSYQVLGDAITALHGAGPFLLDLETGRMETLALPTGVGVDIASLSPWQPLGRRQIVGVGWRRSATRESLQRTDIGLVRMSFPGGEIIDRLIFPDEALPAAPPCWIPGASASVLYAGCDFRLYYLKFEPSRLDGVVEDADNLRPRLVDLQAAVPGASGVQLRDLAWPDDSRLGGRVLASLRFKDRETGRFSDWQVWWLLLDRGCSSIVAAGRLLEDAPANEHATARFPTLVRNSDGAPALAYLAHSLGQSGYQLRVAPIRFDPNSGSPWAQAVDSRLVAEGCLPTNPAMSPDGRWFIVVRASGPQLNTERVAISRGARSDDPGLMRIAGQQRPLAEAVGSPSRTTMRAGPEVRSSSHLSLSDTRRTANRWSVVMGPEDEPDWVDVAGGSLHAPPP